MPLQHFLKQYFSENKKHGSKDRKWISHFCYSFYRLGKSLPHMEIEKRLPIAVYLCTEDLDSLGEYLPMDWLRTNILDEKIQYMQSQYVFQLEKIFPYEDLLMPDLDFVELSKSFLQQPDVFLRIRPGKKDKVVSGLEAAKIDFEQNENVVALKERTAIEQIIEINKDAVVQDLNSQMIASLFPKADIHSIWDCCAASGGKTLLARDAFPKAKITVSDIRESILQNHKKRMQEAGTNVQRYFTTDLSKPVLEMKEKFDLIICDAPCSGSGTWARTPEEMYFFEKDSLKTWSELQLTIVNGIFEYLQEDGYLLYITCSLFREEDDIVIQKILQEKAVSIECKTLFSGLGKKSDTLYGCLLKKKTT